MRDETISQDRRTLTVDLRSGCIRTVLSELADRLWDESRAWATIGASATSTATTPEHGLAPEYGMTVQLTIHLIRRGVPSALYSEDRDR